MLIQFWSILRPGTVQFLGGGVGGSLRPGVSILLGLLLGTACGRAAPCSRCETLVISATGEPDALLPPLVGETVGRDVSDLIYERLATLRAGASPFDSSGYAAGLADRWERVDSVTLRYRLRHDARWHDGRPVTAADVAFSFAAYQDSALDAQARPVLAGRVATTAENDSTVLIRFREPDPEQWYDASWHVRVIPKHVWDSVPPGRWADDTARAHLIGSGPYRLVAWAKGQSLTLEVAGVEPAAGPAIKRIVWRFASDPDAALNMLLTREADMLESIGDSSRVARVVADPALATLPYPAAVYGFLGFNLAGSPTAPVRDRAVRRALTLAVNRPVAARAVLGPGAAAPPGPMSRALWVYDDSIAVLPYDTALAARTLDQAGWVVGAGGGGFRRRSGRELTVDILVPGTSIARRNLAQVVQEMWRQVGVKATVSSVDFPVFQQRLRTGQFDGFVGAWLDEPSPRSLGDQWTAAGVGGLNFCRYRSAAFDSLFRRAARFRGPVAEARRAWREAIDTLNADAPGIWLYTPMNVAGVAKRVSGTTIDPFSWLAGLTTWTVRREE